MATCKCGKRKSKYAYCCKDCHNKMQVRAAADYVEHHNRGTCPECGLPLIPNNSLAGEFWLQCRGYGVLIRKPGDKECGFQVIADKQLVIDLMSEEPNETKRMAEKLLVTA